MSSLISLVRDLIGDSAGADQVFSDDQIERSLDVHRSVHHMCSLEPLPTFVSQQLINLNWYSDWLYWEDGAALYDANHIALSPASSDPLRGHWSFAQHQQMVLISGNVYDAYGAAADLLEMWAGRVAIEFDVETDGARMARSQKQNALLKLAKNYRRQQRVMMAKQERNDVW